MNEFLNSLSPVQWTLLIGGIGLALFAYLLVKLFQWRRRRRTAKRASSSVEQHTLRTSTPPADDQQGANQEELAARQSETVPSKGAQQQPSLWLVERKSAPEANRFADEDAEHPYAGTADYSFGGLTPTLAALVPTSDEGRRTLTRSLRNAGYYEPHAWQNFAALRYLGIILPLLFFGALLVIVPESLEMPVIAGLVIGPALGWAMPALIVRSRAAERLREIENGLPDMLDLLNMCVSQGMTVNQALLRVGRELKPVYPALSKELQIVTDQARVGNLDQALTAFSNRVDVPQVHSFTSLMIQTERMGTSLSESLSDYSDGMRENLKQRADEKANSASFKLLFPTVLCLMPAVFLFLMGPALIELNSFFENGGLGGLDQGANEIIQQQEQR